MERPLISIITPTKNVGSAIEIILRSVLSQRYGNVEHVIVDSASEDNTLDIVRGYAGNNKIKVLSEKDNGIYEAMNKGLKICTGDFICFMGADDEFFDENVLEDLYEDGLFASDHIFYGNVVLKGDAPWAKDGTVYDGPFDLEKLFRKNICQQSVFYPRSVILNVGYFSEKYKVTSDWDYNVRCWAKYKFAYVEKNIAFFKSGGTSTLAGDYSLYEDFPGNIIQYFHIDPDDTTHHFATSPFFYPVARFREMKHLRSIQGLLSDKVKLHELNSAQKEEFIAEQNRLNDQVLFQKDTFYRTVEMLKTEHMEVFRDLARSHETNIIAISKLNNELVAGINRDHEVTLQTLISQNQNLTSELHAKKEIFVKELEKCQIRINELEKYQVRAAELEKYEVRTTELEEYIQEQERGTEKTIEGYRQQISDLELSARNQESVNYNRISLLENQITSLENQVEVLKTTKTEQEHRIDTILNSKSFKVGRTILSPLIFVIKLVTPEKRG
jgi:glycosyltransferase involved in cell wall biosynthesis